MSSRRARIKAVSSLSLPARRRRKSNDNNKLKPCFTPRPQDDTQLITDFPIKTSSKVHMEQASSSEHEKVSDVPFRTTKGNGVHTELTPANNFNLSVPEQSKTKTNDPETKSESTILANALTRPLTKKNFVSKIPTTVNPTQRNTNDDPLSNTIVKILSNLPNARWNSSNVNTNENREKQVGRHGVEEVRGVEGIVPLSRSRSDTVELFKSDIMSENAEVLFDPILPLPSHHNLPPPSPCGNTIQGSGSESEDEHKLGAAAVCAGPAGGGGGSAEGGAGAGRVRRISQSSRQARPSTLRSRSAVTSRPSVRRGAKKLCGSALKRNQLTLYELIFQNPIVEKEDEVRDVKKMEESDIEGEVSEEEEGEGKEEEEEEETMPAPQVKIGPDGQIVIDETSLVYKSKRGAGKLSARAVHESEGDGGGGYRRRKRTRGWSEAETVRFYRALTAVGTDFTLMLSLFPDRTRRDIKNKFKKEERQNGVQIDKALMAHVDFDVESMARQFERERREVRERARRIQQDVSDAKRAHERKIELARERGLHYSKAAKSMLEMMPIKKQSLNAETAHDIILFNSLNQSTAKDKGTRSEETVRPPQTTPLAKFASTTQSYVLPAGADPMSVAKGAAPGSLVCLTVPDPADSANTMLQVYVSDGARGMSPATLPPAMLNYVKEYMNSRAAVASSYTIINL